MTSTDQGRFEPRRTWLVLGLILALAALVRVFSFRGYTTYDAAEYTRLAHMLITGAFRPGMLWFFPVFSMRVGLFAPVALAFRVGGVNEAMLIAYPFLLSMLSVLVAYFAAKAMFGARAGLIAACLLALLPIDAGHASQLLPDLPAAFWMNAGVLLTYAGSRRETVSGKVVCGALAGLSLFASWLCKETVLYLLPFVGLYMLWLVIKDRRNAALLAAGTVVAGLFAGLESWTYHRYAGDYLLRFHALGPKAGGGTNRMMRTVTTAGTARYLVHRAGEVLHFTLLNVDDFGLTPAAALFACAYAAFRRKRRFLLPALWFCWLLLLFGFGSASLRTYSPLHLSMTRFQYPMLLPAILLISGLASSFLSPSGPTEPEMPYRARLFSRLLLITYLSVLFLVTATWGVRLGMGRECRVEREIAGVLKPTDPLYTDWHTAVALQFFWKFPATDSTHDFEGVTLSQLPSRVYVLLNRDELKAMRYNAKYVLPRFLDSVPPTWQKLRDKDNAILYWIPPFPVSN